MIPAIPRIRRPAVGGGGSGLDGGLFFGPGGGYIPADGLFFHGKTPAAVVKQFMSDFYRRSDAAAPAGNSQRGFNELVSVHGLVGILKTASEPDAIHVMSVTTPDLTRDQVNRVRAVLGPDKVGRRLRLLWSAGVGKAVQDVGTADQLLGRVDKLHSLVRGTP